MNHGVKVSHQGEDISNAENAESGKAKVDSKKRKLPHLLYALALPYVFGAKTQIDRYKTEAATLKEHPVTSVQVCLHEVSCLFEDLSTVGKYAEMCGHTHELHKLWLDVRNHIRHDVREELDNETDARKNARAKRLGLNPKLQTSIGFDVDAINVGSTNIKLDTVEEYLGWAGGVIGGVLADAQAKGWIK